VDGFQSLAIRAERLPQAADRLGQRVLVHDPARPARFEQAVLVDVLAGLVQQGGEDTRTGAVETDRSTGNPQSAARGVEFDLAETRHSAVHRSPRALCHRPRAESISRAEAEGRIQKFS
jgi:hypothetical protein